MRKFFSVILILISFQAFSQADHGHAFGRIINFPNIPGYKTMKCDLHMHTVFSDGRVWPEIRVLEALMDSLDAISLTEHLEYQPHKADIPHPDRNRSYDLAVEEAKDHKLMIIKGSEITRRMPPGHCNAIFIEDANKLLIKDSIDVFREAKRQGAFVFWNHPHWVNQRKDGMATLTDMHNFLIKEKLLDGIEVVNDRTYSDEALKIALDNNLTIMGTSDVHHLIDWDYSTAKGGHRPVTLVFSKERSIESIKEGLMERRTVVFFNNVLIGRNEYLLPLIQESLKITSAKYTDRYDVLTLEIESLCSSEFILRNTSSYTFYDNADVITIEPGKKNILKVKPGPRVSEIELKFEVMNAVNAPKSHPQITLKAGVTK